MTKQLGKILALFLFAFSALAHAGAEAEDPAKYSGKVENRKLVCMLQDSMQARDGLEHTYNGKTYYLCCGGCVTGFEKDPKRYSHATDPVNGNSVDKAEAPIFAYQGRAYFFSSTETLGAFAENPAKYLGSAAASGAAPASP